MSARLVPLDEVCRKRSSNLRLKDVVNGEDGPYPVYGASGIVGYSGSYQIDREYVAVVKDGAGVGRVLKCEANSSVLGTLQPIVPANSVNRDYLFAILETLDLAKYTSGSTIPHIYFKDYGKELIPYLDRAGQNLLASRFRTINRALGAYNSLIERFDLLVKSRFIELCGTMQSERIPISRLVSSDIEPTSKRYSKHDEIAYIDISSIDVARHQVKHVQKMPISEAPSRAQQCVQHGDILVSTVRPALRNIAQVESKEENLVASSGFCVLRAVSCPPEYLLANLLMDDFSNAMCRIATGANYPAVKKKDVLNYGVPSLSPTQMNEISTYMRQVDKLRFDVQRQIEKLEILKKSLMQEYFG